MVCTCLSVTITQIRPLPSSVSRPQARTVVRCRPKEPSVSFSPSSQLETPALLWVSSPLLLTSPPPPQKAGAGTWSLRLPAPFGSPCEPTQAPAPTSSPASGHRIRPSAQTPGWTAWTVACSLWSLPCYWSSIASCPQVLQKESVVIYSVWTPQGVRWHTPPARSLRAV